MTIAALENIYIIFFKMMLSKNFYITDLRELKFMLGIFITCDYTN